MKKLILLLLLLVLLSGCGFVRYKPVSLSQDQQDVVSSIMGSGDRACIDRIASVYMEDLEIDQDEYIYIINCRQHMAVR